MHLSLEMQLIDRWFNDDNAEVAELLDQAKVIPFIDGSCKKISREDQDAEREHYEQLRLRRIERMQAIFA